MTNHIVLSAASIHKIFSRTQADYEIDLPLKRKARISVSQLLVGENQIRIPVHTDVPLASGFEIVLTDFRSQGTTVMLTMKHVGVIPSPIISMLGKTVATLFARLLSKAAVRVEGSNVTIDFSRYLPDILNDINVTSLVICNGIDIAFEY